MSQSVNGTTVQVWKVGRSYWDNLALTPQEVSAHLLSDWLPGVPAGQGVAFMGWPNRLLSSKWGQLCLSDLVARTERQWKGMISWMLGVAGARAYLKDDNYRWIAPVSAFFENAVQPVTVPQWYLPFPEPDLTINRVKPRVLCPDYIVARSSANGATIEWAVAEAKGTAKSLAMRTACEADWQAQVRNVRIDLQGSPLTPQRHIVIATRVNPSGPDRVLRIKAWNHQEPDDSDAFAPALPEVVCAHLFGLYAGLGLSNISRQLAFAVFQRATRKYRANLRWRELAKERPETHGAAAPDGLPEQIAIHAGEDTVLVDLSAPLRRLTLELSKIDRQEEALKAIREADEALDEWWELHRQPSSPSTVTLPFGIRVRFPERT